MKPTSYVDEVIRMRIENKLMYKNIVLLLLGCLLALDVALRLEIDVFPDGWLPIDSAQAQPAEASAAKVEKRRPPIHFPPFPIEAGRGRLFHIGLGVADLDASVAFYRDQLGFKVIRYQEFGDVASTAFIQTGDGEPIIELMQAKMDREGIPSLGLTHIGIFIDDVDRIYAKTSEAGATWEGKPAPLGPGAPYAGFIRDPDGTRIEIMENPKGGCTSCHRGPHLN